MSTLSSLLLLLSFFTCLLLPTPISMELYLGPFKISPPLKLKELDFYNLPGLKEFHQARKSLEMIETPYPKVAVVDSGLDLEMAKSEGYHFNPKELRAFNLVPSSFISGMYDNLSHGTGIFLQLGAKENGFGMVGLIPGLNITPIKIGTAFELQNEKVPFHRLIWAFELAKRKGIKIINLSLSNWDYLWPKSKMQHLLKKYEKDFLVVSSVGNDKRYFDYKENCPLVPVCLKAPNLLKIGAKNYSHSNVGPVTDIFAFAKIYQWKRLPSFSYFEKRHYFLKPVWSTSHSTPLITALAALLWKASPHLTPMEIKNRLLSSLDKEKTIDPLKTMATFFK